MKITGPGRDVSIHGTLLPKKRPRDDSLDVSSAGPSTIVRRLGTMVQHDEGGADQSCAGEPEPELADESVPDTVQDTQDFDTFFD